MTTIYDDITAAIFPELSYFCVGGTSFHVYRGNTSGTITLQTSVVTAYVIPVKPDNFLAALPQILLWNKPWVIFAAIGTLIQSNDVLVSVSDSTYIFALLGRVTKFYGMLAAPADETTLVT
jgi:hypothetical protein